MLSSKSVERLAAASQVQYGRGEARRRVDARRRGLDPPRRVLIANQVLGALDERTLAQATVPPHIDPCYLRFHLCVSISACGRVAKPSSARRARSSESGSRWP